jgi:hypothetical protein
LNPASLGLAAFNRASHVMSRTALDGFPLQDTEKDHLMAIVAKLCKIYFVDLLGFCLYPVKYGFAVDLRSI